MKRYPGLLLLLLVLVLGTSCLVTTQSVTVNAPEEVPLFSAQSRPDTPYEERIHFELTGAVWTPRAKLKKRLIAQARKHQCDAVIDVRFKTTFIWPQAFGVGVVYAD